jgi:3-oxoacyl-[acyl-carrier protein] reductase
VAIVTGAGKGLGKAIAERFSREGALVVVNDVSASYAESVATRIDKRLKTTLPVEADVSSLDQVKAMFRQTVKKFGKVDILVNCAGIRTHVPIRKLTESNLAAVLDANLKGSFHCTHVAQKYMVERNAGKILLFSSPFPPGVAGEGHAAYAATGAGIEGLTRALALELGKYNVNVNCIAPDFVDTDMTRKSAREAGMYMEDFKKLVVAQIPLRRLGKPEEVASLARFLCSDESSFITGQVITIRGGP